MSIKLMSQVWEREIDHPEQSVLLALADHANDDGEHVRPSMEYVAWKTGYSLRQTQRLVGALKKRKVLLVTRPGFRAPNEYRIDLNALPFKRPFERTKDMPPGFRESIINRDGQTCSYCGKAGNDVFGPDSQPWHMDRIIPGSKGGQYEPSNVNLSCGTCNRSKGAKMAPEPTVPLGDSLGAIPGDSGAVVKAADPSVEPLNNNRHTTRAYKSEPTFAIDDVKDPATFPGIESQLSVFGLDFTHVYHQWWLKNCRLGGIGRRPGSKATARQYAASLEGYFGTWAHNEAERNGGSNGNGHKKNDDDRPIWMASKK